MLSVPRNRSRRRALKRRPRALERRLESGQLIEAKRRPNRVAPILRLAVNEGLQPVLGDDGINGFVRPAPMLLKFAFTPSMKVSLASVRSPAIRRR